MTFESSVSLSLRFVFERELEPLVPDFLPPLPAFATASSCWITVMNSSTAPVR